VNIFG